MDIDYQRKYIGLQNLCKKQEQTISKLQAEIKERCQSYLLHSSRYKRTNNNQEQVKVMSKQMSPKCEENRSLTESVVTVFEEAPKSGEDNLMGRSNILTDSQLLKIKISNFTISTQVTLTQQLQSQLAREKDSQQVDMELIIKGYKERIVRIQQQKNKYVKQIEKTSIQLSQNKNKVLQLQKKLQVFLKNQKKIKAKIDQVNQFQQTLSQIYKQFNYKLGNKAECLNIQNFESTQINEKLNYIFTMVKSLQIRNQQIKYSPFESQSEPFQKQQDNTKKQQKECENCGSNTQKSIIDKLNTQAMIQQKQNNLSHTFDVSVNREIEQLQLKFNEKEKAFDIQKIYIKDYYESKIERIKQQIHNQYIDQQDKQIQRKLEQKQKLFEDQRIKMKILYQNQINRIKNQSLSLLVDQNKNQIRRIQQRQIEFQKQRNERKNYYQSEIERIQSEISNSIINQKQNQIILKMDQQQRQFQKQKMQMKACYEAQLQRANKQISNAYIQNKYMQQMNQKLQDQRNFYKIKSQLKNIDQNKQQYPSNNTEDKQYLSTQLVDPKDNDIQKQKLQLKAFYEEQLNKLKNQLDKSIDETKKLKQSYDQLQQQNLSLINQNMQKQNELSNIKMKVSRKQKQLQQTHLQMSKYKQNFKSVQSDYSKTKQELDKSRSIIDDLQSSRISRDVKDIHDFTNQNSKVFKNDTLNNSAVKVGQRLEEPYYIEEELQNDPNNQYVKRSFIRKKIVRRNLSATAYRIVSKSKEQVKQIIKNKVHQYADKSLQKKQKLKQNSKKQSLKNSINYQRISEVSQENRQSDYMGQQGDIIKVIQVTTTTPIQEIKTTKVYSNNKQQKISFRRRGNN